VACARRQRKGAALRQRVLQGRVGTVPVDAHLLVAQRLAGRQHIVGRRQPVGPAVIIDQQAVVLLVVVGVVDQDVEHHAPEQLGALRGECRRVGAPAQQQCEVRIAEGLPRGAQRDMRRQRVQAQRTGTIEAAHGHGMPVRDLQWPRFAHLDAGVRGEPHRRVFDQRAVERVAGRGELAVRTNQFSGSADEFAAGSVIVLPGLHELRRFTLRDQTYRPAASGEAPFQSVEGLSFGVDMAVRYALDPARMRQMAQTLPADIGADIAQPAVQGVIYSVFTRYTVREIFSSRRAEIQAAIEAELNPSSPPTACCCARYRSARSSCRPTTSVAWTRCSPRNWRPRRCATRSS
jgi:hypothetical protein